MHQIASDQHMKELATSLRQFVEENFLFGVPVPYSNDDSLLERSIIDSTGVLELITHLENAFHIMIDDEELVPENLDTINNMARFVARKQALACGGTTEAGGAAVEHTSFE